MLEKYGSDQPFLLLPPPGKGLMDDVLKEGGSNQTSPLLHDLRFQVSPFFESSLVRLEGDSVGPSAGINRNTEGSWDSVWEGTGQQHPRMTSSSSLAASCFLHIFFSI